MQSNCFSIFYSVPALVSFPHVIVHMENWSRLMIFLYYLFEGEGAVAVCLERFPSIVNGKAIIAGVDFFYLLMEAGKCDVGWY